MAQNPYVNKVVFGNDTLLDLTEDSVTENTLLEGETAHSATGEPITGTAKQGHTIWNAIKTALTQRTKLWFADAKVTDDSTEQATKVEVVQLIDDESELTNAPDGVYQGDYEDAPEDVLDASMVAYNDGSVEDALDDLAIQNLWILYGHTAQNTASATWNTDSRVSRSVLLSVQVKLSDDNWYIMAQTSGIASVAQVDSTGYPNLYIQNASFYDKDCRAIYMTIS